MLSHNPFTGEPLESKDPTGEIRAFLQSNTFVLLDAGFVKLVDYMGDDSAIVQAARVSYGQGTKTPEEDAKLIRYLMRNDHTSPFEMVEFKFHVKCPIYVARQWVRHRTASWNEISGRYTEMLDEFHLPYPEEFAMQSTNNKQGRAESMPLEVGQEFYLKFRQIYEDAYKVYNEAIEAGMAKEQARIILPLATYTQFYWKIDLHNLLRFLKLRLDPHAQLEIREYAGAISEIVKLVVPVTWTAFKEYKLDV